MNYQTSDCTLKLWPFPGAEIWGFARKVAARLSQFEQKQS
jgi:hypothetical protein